MEREWLEQRLEAGRSIESIARESGLSPSTVAYWANKYGLASAHAPRHRSRGGIERSRLEALVREGRSIRKIAAELGLGYTTVRHWLARYELTTPRARRLAETAQARAEGAETVEGRCAVHGPVTFVRRGKDGFRCQRCRTDAVERRRRKVKQMLVDEAGGACALCGYSRSIAGLHFHHVDPALKAFALSHRGVTLSLDRARAEAAKCVLLCSNCHAEVEMGLATVPQSLLWEPPAGVMVDPG
jgi:transposase-like protein